MQLSQPKLFSRCQRMNISKCCSFACRRKSFKVVKTLKSLETFGYVTDFVFLRLQPARVVTLNTQFPGIRSVLCLGRSTTVPELVSHNDLNFFCIACKHFFKLELMTCLYVIGSFGKRGLNYGGNVGHIIAADCVTSFLILNLLLFF